MTITSRTTTVGITPKYQIPQERSSRSENKPSLTEMKEDLKMQEAQLKDLLNNIPNQLNKINGVAASRSGLGQNLDILV